MACEGTLRHACEDRVHRIYVKNSLLPPERRFPRISVIEYPSTLSLKFAENGVLETKFLFFGFFDVHCGIAFFSKPVMGAPIR